MEFKKALFSTEHGTSVVPWAKKRLTHPKGWMVMLLGHTTYDMTYENGGQFTNTSYNGAFYDLKVEVQCQTEFVYSIAFLLPLIKLTIYSTLIFPESWGK